MPRTFPFSKEIVNNLVSTFGTPLQIYDGDGIRKHALNFMEAMRLHFPSFEQYFAVKALPNPHILKLLKECGMGFDCSSVPELYIADRLKGKIMYTSNYTSEDDLDYALQFENTIINLDDIDGFENLQYNVNRYGYDYPDTICFRYNPNFGGTSSETKSNILGGQNSKFGMPIDRLIMAYKLAKEEGIKKFGIHTMTGSCILDINYWSGLTDAIFEAVDRLKKELDIDLEFINLGGGIGIPYRPLETEIDIDKLALLLRQSFDRNMAKYGLTHEPKLVMENGRYITGSFGWLISTCTSIKKTTSDISFFGLDACMAHLMRCGMYNAYHHISILGKEFSPFFQHANVVGTLCENNDWFARNILLPSDAQKDDLFIIYDTGAHSHSMGFQYNAKLRAPEIMYINDSFKLIRKRETIDDYFSTVIKDF
uniref:Orn/DAP/Arg decarboxylase 2 N-terminal domain-containing protein n=1 Tax=viral metagenome TaxID=1070528 RepID=A0A6C0EAX0_9ZZZZ